MPPKRVVKFKVGRLMKELTEKTRGRADGKLVSELVKAQLQG